MSSSAAEQRLAYWQNYKYFEGHLLIKVQRLQNYEKRWVVLLGNEIHLYTTKIPQRDQGSSKPIQHYPLHSTIVVQSDSDSKMYIKCDLWSLRAQAASNEEKENWRIRICTISKGEPPDQGRLLPGQREVLADILQKEQTRKYNQGRLMPSRRGSSPGHLQHHLVQSSSAIGRKRGGSLNDASHGYTDNTFYHFLPEDITYSQVLPPVWFLGKISRAKAEEVLHQSTSNGDLLLRESEAHPGQFTLSVRQDTDSKSLIRHYMFKKDPYGSGFILLIEDKPPVLKSMYELMWFFIQESGGHLLPLQNNPHLPPPDYDTRVPVTDPSNGEPVDVRRKNFQKAFSSDASFPVTTGHRVIVEENNENDYLVPDVPSPKGQRSSLKSVSEFIENDTYSPAADDLPTREAPLPPPGARHPLSPPAFPLPSTPPHLERPASVSDTTTGYVKMRSLPLPPTTPGKSDDAGYMNMQRLSQTDRGGDGVFGSGDGGSPGGGSSSGEHYTQNSCLCEEKQTNKSNSLCQLCAQRSI